MPSSGAPEGRRSRFLIAAVALPVLVVAVFLLATAIPRWTVPPPEHDFLMQTEQGSQPAGSFAVTIKVRDGRVEADLTPRPPETYRVLPALWLFDHEKLELSEVRIELPGALEPGETLRTVPIASLANRRVLTGLTSPDGYAFDYRYQGGAGLVGSLFGMDRYGARAALRKNGRAIPVQIPEPLNYSLHPIGWLESEGR